MHRKGRLLRDVGLVWTLYCSNVVGAGTQELADVPTTIAFIFLTAANLRTNTVLHMELYGRKSMWGRTRGRSSHNIPQCHQTRDFDLNLGIAKPWSWTADQRLANSMFNPYHTRTTRQKEAESNIRIR